MCARSATRGRLVRLHRLDCHAECPPAGAIDSTALANYNLGQVQGEPQSAEDTVVQARGKISRDFDLGRIPSRVHRRVGRPSCSVSMTTPSSPDVRRPERRAEQRGGHGVVSRRRGRGDQSRFRSPGRAVAQPLRGLRLFQGYSTHFGPSSNVGDTLRNIAASPRLVYERISAGYVMGDT